MSTSKKGMLGSALAHAAGPLKDLIDRLSGEEGELWLRALKKFLRKEETWSMSRSVMINGRRFPIWKTITIGGKTPEQLTDELEQKGFEIGDWARDLMKRKSFTTLPEPREIDLVVLTAADLGFSMGDTTKQNCDRGKELGLGLCPAEAGPHLRLAYGDQPKDEWIWIAMEQIVGSGDYPGIFTVCCGPDGDRWLGSDLAPPGFGWNPEHRFAFAAPRE